MNRSTVYLVVLLILLLGVWWQTRPKSTIEIVGQIKSVEIEPKYWLLLKRKSNQEYLYQGVPGEITLSSVVKEFKVKSGIPGSRPTPLPKLVGRDYWLIIEKRETTDSLETAPFFLTLNIPTSDVEPFGPIPYLECNGQCNWIVPGAFGLHGVSGDNSRLSDQNPGSSGCIRHTNEDITYLYNLLDPQVDEIRYYIEDI